ncbi:MAG: HAMP domain-containing histidine kinase [Xanthomonadaceae bacterium]|nr:HAMP domain-containing histidine kinase [Xanthomonadaceae bacterium]
MPYGLPRKIRVVFILQLVLVSIAILASYYVVLFGLSTSLVKSILQKEMDYYWQEYTANPALPVPNVYNLRGFLLHDGEMLEKLPAELRGLDEGYHLLDDDRRMVLMRRHGTDRIYLVFMHRQAMQIGYWYGFLPVMLAILAIYLATWAAYRSSKRLVSPVTWLARQVSRWDPRNPDVSSLAPEKLPADVKGEAKQLAEALHILAARMTALLVREQNFTRDASHELRTPLTVIRVATDMALADPGLNPRMERSLQRIQRAGRDMEAVIDAFLILARESEVKPQREWFNVGDIVEYEAESARQLLAHKPVALQVELEANPRLHAPPRVLQVIVGNLLRNACNYTDTGIVKVTVEADRVVVRDTGIGMSADTVSRVFDPFYRAEPDRAQGVGLGLSIVRRLSDRFGWIVELDSVPGEGTTAVLRFVV